MILKHQIYSYIATAIIIIITNTNNNNNNNNCNTVIMCQINLYLQHIMKAQRGRRGRALLVL